MCFHCVRRGWGGQPVWTGEQQRGGWTGATTPPLSLSKTVISISVDSPGPWQTLPSLPTLFSWTSTGLCHQVPHKRLLSGAFTLFSGAFTATNVIGHTSIYLCVCVCVCAFIHMVHPLADWCYRLAVCLWGFIIMFQTRKSSWDQRELKVMRTSVVFVFRGNIWL